MPDEQKYWKQSFFWIFKKKIGGGSKNFSVGINVSDLSGPLAVDGNCYIHIILVFFKREFWLRGHEFFMEPQNTEMIVLLKQ